MINCMDIAMFFTLSISPSMNGCVRLHNKKPNGHNGRLIVRSMELNTVIDILLLLFI